MNPMNVALIVVWTVAIALSFTVSQRTADCASVKGTWIAMVMDCPK
jgi:Na+-driven multidrug efflux pump